MKTPKEELIEAFNIAMDYGDFYLASELKEKIEQLEINENT